MRGIKACECSGAAQGVFNDHQRGWENRNLCMSNNTGGLTEKVSSSRGGQPALDTRRKDRQAALGDSPSRRKERKIEKIVFLEKNSRGRAYPH